MRFNVMLPILKGGSWVSYPMDTDIALISEGSNLHSLENSSTYLTKLYHIKAILFSIGERLRILLVL